MRKILLIITLTTSLLLNLALISSLDKESSELITTKFLLNIIEEEYGLVLCPDAGSNDKEYHKMIKDKIDCDMIILDHHEIEGAPSMYAITLNNQTSRYPNKFLSGVGITWQFCRYIDKLMGKNFANDYLDLVALGNCADMMSMLSIETKQKKLSWV